MKKMEAKRPKTLLERIRGYLYREKKIGDIDIGKVKVLHIRGKMGTLRDAKLSNRDLYIPSLDQTYLLTDQKEVDLDTCFLRLIERKGETIAPLFVAFEDMPTIYPIKHLKNAIIDEKLLLAVDGKIDNEQITQLFSKNITDAIFFPKMPWARILSLCAITGLYTYMFTSMLHGYQPSQLESMGMFGVFMLVFVLSVWMNKNG